MIGARVALFLVVVLFAGFAHAERCGDEARAWIDRCAETTGVALELESCPAGVAIVRTPEVRIEISTSDKAFARAGAYGLSPIGSFPDWKSEPAPRRAAFDAVLRCVSAEAPMALLAPDASAPPSGSNANSDASSDASPNARTWSRPWLFVAAVVAALLALIPSMRRARPIAIAVVGVAVVFILRRALGPFAFFHQNGQGPVWIEFAFGGDAGEYGPGYPELFGFAARVHRPDRGVAFFQEALAATVPLSAYAIARAASARRRTAALLFVAFALDPVLTRVAGSESYFSAIGALLFAAAAVLAESDRRSLGLHRALGIVAAALLVGQAARIHPLAWVPSALVPLVIFCRPGRVRDRARRTLVAAISIAALVTPLVLPTLRAGLTGRIGGEFLPGVRHLLVERGVWAAIFIVVAGVLAVLPSTRSRGSRIFVLVVVVAVAALSDMLANDARVVHAAHLHLFAPAAVAGIAYFRARWDAVAVGALVAAHFFSERGLLVLPTDAREEAWALEWREQLPRGSEIASVSRAGLRLLLLPLLGEGLPRWQPIDEGGHASFGEGAHYYYRGSLCVTPEGAPTCARFESEHTLRLVDSRRFPSIASLPWAPMPPGEVEVALFAIEK